MHIAAELGERGIIFTQTYFVLINSLLERSKEEK